MNQVTKATEDPRLLPDPPEHEFDHFDAALAECPFERWRMFQQEMPVFRTPAHGGFAVLSKYEDCRHGLMTPAIYSSADGVTLPPIPKPGPFIPAEVDPPAHRAYRNLIMEYFTPKAVTKFEPYLRARATELLEAARARGTFDFVHDIAEPFTRISAFELLGFPRKDEARLSRLVAEALGIDVEPAAVERASAELFGYVTEIIEARKQGESTGDLTSAIVHGTVEGEQMSLQEMQLSMLLMIFAGLHTTSVAISGMFHWLGLHPEARGRLRDSPDLISTALHEFVRYTTPSGNQCRKLTEDVALHGYRLSAGSWVMLLDEAANRDPDQFENPDEVILERSPNRHLGFGAGPHRCAGEHLGLLEMRIMLEEGLRALPGYVIDEARVRWIPGNARGLASCPASVSPPVEV